MKYFALLLLTFNIAQAQKKTTVVKTAQPATNLTSYLLKTEAAKAYAPSIHTHPDYVNKTIVFTPVRKTSYTLTADDESKWIDFDCPTDCNAGLPAPSIFKTGTQITVSNIGSTRVQFTPVSGVRILTEKNASALTNINATATLIVKDASTWQIIGSINP